MLSQDNEGKEITKKDRCERYERMSVFKYWCKPQVLLLDCKLKQIKFYLIIGYGIFCFDGINRVHDQWNMVADWQ